MEARLNPEGEFSVTLKYPDNERSETLEARINNSGKPDRIRKVSLKWIFGILFTGGILALVFWLTLVLSGVTLHDLFASADGLSFYQYGELL